MSEWQPVSGYAGKYEVSKCGLVRKADGTLVGQWPNDQGYMIVRLANPRSQHRVHRLVAAAFVANPDALDVVNHIDGNRSNNCADNLEWCTQRHNLDHAEKSGRLQRSYWRGKRSPNARLSDKTASAIRQAYASGHGSMAALAKKFGTSKRTVGRIINGETYV